MYGAPAAWHRLCDMLADVIADYLIAQIEAGVDAVQVFDSWVGALNAARLSRVHPAAHAPHLRRARAATTCRRFISASAPARSSASCARPAATSSAPTGASRSTRRGSASATTAPSRATSIRRCCSAPLDRIFAGADDVLERAGGRPGHIFNLGHGILPSTPVEHVQALARYVHQQTQHSAVRYVIRTLHPLRSTLTMTWTGVLLMAHGTPSSLDEMPEYLRLVRGGRPPSAELVARDAPQLRARSAAARR